MKFRFRAECLADARVCQAALLRWIDDWQESVAYLDGDPPERVPDVEVQFETCDDDLSITDLSLREVRWIFSQFSDLHIPVETVDRASHYTGNRNDVESWASIKDWTPDEDVLQIVQENLQTAKDLEQNVVRRLAPLLI